MRTNTLSPVLVEIRTKAICWIQESADTFHPNHQDSFIPPHGLQLTANKLPAKWSRYPDSRLLRQVDLTVDILKTNKLTCEVTVPDAMALEKLDHVVWQVCHASVARKKKWRTQHHTLISSPSIHWNYESINYLSTITITLILIIAMTQLLWRRGWCVCR